MFPPPPGPSGFESLSHHPVEEGRKKPLGGFSASGKKRWPERRNASENKSI
jgi:hypothetical protein